MVCGAVALGPSQWGPRAQRKRTDSDLEPENANWVKLGVRYYLSFWGIGVVGTADHAQ